MPERKTFLLRIDPALWAQLESWSAAELRSVNGQIEYILRQAVQQRIGKPSDSPDSPTRRQASAMIRPSLSSRKGVSR